MKGREICTYLRIAGPPICMNGAGRKKADPKGDSGDTVKRFWIPQS